MQSPDILSDTHKILFRRLEVIVSFKSGSHENQWNCRRMWEFEKIAYFWSWKSAFSFIEIHLKMLHLLPEMIPMCQAKTGDIFRYPQNTFMTLRSHFKLQNGHPWKSVKLKENVGILKYFQNFHCFYQEKVDFPASKSTSECCMYPSNFSKSVKHSLEILIHTHKMFFGHLDHILETIRKTRQKHHIARLFVHSSKWISSKMWIFLGFQNQ